MKIVQLTTDNRNQHRKWTLENPYFGTAPESLLQGFAAIPECEIHVISCSSRPTNNPEKIAPNIFFHGLNIPKIGWGRTLFLGCTFATRRLIASIRPDIVHGQGTERDCAMEAVHCGFPNVLTIHGNMRVHAARPEQAGSVYYKIAARLESYCLKRTDGIVAISNYTKNLVEPLNIKTWLLPNAAHGDYFEVIRKPDQIPRILFVGALGIRKNPRGLLKACEPFLREGACTLSFAGGGGDGDSEYYAAFLREAADIPGVEMLGFVGREELILELSRASCLILPTFEDNCPMVVLEAMAAALPVAASNVGGIPDLIEHEVSGLLFDPHLPGDLESCVGRLLSDTPLRERLAEGGKRAALLRFHPKVIAQEHLAIYREVIDSHKIS